MEIYIAILPLFLKGSQEIFRTDGKPCSSKSMGQLKEYLKGNLNTFIKEEERLK